MIANDQVGQKSPGQLWISHKSPGWMVANHRCARESWDGCESLGWSQLTGRDSCIYYHWGKKKRQKKKRKRNRKFTMICEMAGNVFGYHRHGCKCSGIDQRCTSSSLGDINTNKNAKIARMHSNDQELSLASLQRLRNVLVMCPFFTGMLSNAWECTAGYLWMLRNVLAMGFLTTRMRANAQEGTRNMCVVTRTLANIWYSSQDACECLVIDQEYVLTPRIYCTMHCNLSWCQLGLCIPITWMLVNAWQWTMNMYCDQQDACECPGYPQ